MSTTPPSDAVRVAVYGRDGDRVLLDDGVVPDVALRSGEDPVDAALRVIGELGLHPTGPPSLLGVSNRDGLVVSFVCAVEGDPVGGSWAEVYFLGSGHDLLQAWLEKERLETRLRLWRLSCDMFVVNEGRILLLQRTGASSEGIWYIPGGIANPQEDPLDAAVRETHEESGLGVRDVELLRVWSYVADHGLDAIHATYVGRATRSDVVLSDEHTGHRWLTPREYLDGYWSDLERSSPELPFLSQVRRNVELLIERLEEPRGPR